MLGKYKPLSFGEGIGVRLNRIYLPPAPSKGGGVSVGGQSVGYET
jgi:hypothetical protein